MSLLGFCSILCHLFPAEYTDCIQHNFTLLQEELPYADLTTTIMEHMLDQSNISDIESCTGQIRQKSKLLKIILTKGKPACKELLRALEVDLKRPELIQKMNIRSAYIKARGNISYLLTMLINFGESVCGIEREVQRVNLSFNIY